MKRMPPTKAKIDAYLKSGGSICPFCDGKDIGPSLQVFSEGREAMREIHCENCGEKWRDVLKIAGIEEADFLYNRT